MSNTITIGGYTTTTTGGYTTTTSSTNTTKPYIYHKEPFNIIFEWNGKQVGVSLKNGNDLFKLAKVFINTLEINNIEYNIKTNKKRNTKL